MLKIQYIFGGIGILLIGLLGFFFWGPQNFSEEATVVEEGKNTIHFGEEVEYPNLERQLVFPASFPEDARIIIKNNIATLTASLKENPSSFEGWSNLASAYTVIEDYEGVREIFLFLNEASPENTVSRINLGNLYHFRFHEYQKAEESFKEALALNKNLPEAYLGLHELYRYSYKQDTNLAENILKEGISATPRPLDLIATLAGFYKAKGEKENAIIYFTKARDEAKKVGNQEMVLRFEEELKDLSL